MLAYRAGRPIRAAQFLAEVHALAGQLLPGRHVINACVDRYRFAVGLAAAVLAGKVSLLPPSQTPEVVRHLRSFAADVFCLTDAHCELDVPQLRYPQLAPAECPWRVPAVDAERIIAYVFTSGSTGVPVAYPKTWGRLIQCVREGAKRLGVGPGASLLATVPAQHMYGFESTVLLPLASAAALCAERPFYPADVCQTLSVLPHPRVLVTTPIHLRALMAYPDTLPAADLILSATAPLSQTLAREAETRFQGPLWEIYGSTESGQLATRRSVREQAWRLWPGIALAPEGGRVWARGGHLEQATPLCDQIEPLDAERFLLHGRLADLVNIGGKRSSLAYLTHQLLGIEGVRDGAFFSPESAPLQEGGPMRVAAAAVAPGLNASEILRALRTRIDPVFLPRPLLLLERLPRNSTGKLPQEALRALLAPPTHGAA